MSPSKAKTPPKKQLAPEPAPASLPKTLQRRRLFLIITGALLLVGFMGAGYAFAYQHRYLPHTTVSGLAIGGKTRAEAEAALQARTTEYLARSVSLSFRDKNWTVTPEQLGAAVTSKNALDLLWESEKGGGWGEQLKKLFLAPVTPRAANASITMSAPAGEAYLKEHVLKDIEVAFKETDLSFTAHAATVVPGKAGEKLQRVAFEDAVAGLLSSGKTAVTLQTEPSQPEVSEAQAAVARDTATKLLASDFTLKLAEQSFVVKPEQLSGWLDTEVDHDAAGAATGLKLVLKSDATTALDEWSAKVTKDPLNARLGITDGKVTVLENDKNGTSVNKEKSLAAFTAAVQTGAHTATGVIQTAQAAVRADTIASLGLNELVGTATTDFSGSPNNRKFNIAKGAQALDRKLVKAGETFSTTGTLGPVEESTGYLPELVIKGNRTVPEAGGGLCQVSTTLFRSVLNAGLPIIERQNHAYRVSYYERDTGPGLDATVYIPNPDLKWKNDFGSAVFVQSTIVGTKITFDLYGTKDGRVSNIPKATILEVYPVGDAIYVNTDTLDKGVTKQIERAHDGAKTSVTYTVSRDGKEIYKKTFVSIYRAWPAQYLVGTHDPGTAQPTE